MVKISQSLMKAYVDYLQNKECGLLFQAKYITKDPEAETPPTDAMKRPDANKVYAAMR